MPEVDDIVKAIGESPQQTQEAPPNPEADNILKAIGATQSQKPTAYTLGEVALGTAQNVATGAVKEISDAFYGPLVLSVSKFSPGAAKWLYDKSQAETPLTAQNPAAPVASYIGSAIGLGAISALGGASVGGQAAVGGFLGATKLKNPELSDYAEWGGRVADALEGAAGFVVGKAVGDLATSGVAKLVNAWGASRLTTLARESVEGMEVSGNSLRDKINDTFSGMMKKVRGDYRLKDIHGNSIVGQSSLNLGDGLSEFIENNKLTDKTRDVLRSATQTITGVDEDLPMLKGMRTAAASGQEYMKNLDAFMEGRLKGLPTESFAPSDLLLSFARVDKAWKSEASRATKSQLGKLRGVMDDEIKRIAAAAGRSPVTLKAQAASLDKFYQENVVPFTNYFGVPKNYNPPITSLTSRQFDSGIIKLFEEGDPEELAKVMTVLKGHEDHVAKLIMQKAINTGKQGEKFNLRGIADYFREHSDMMKQLPSQYKEMANGFMNYLSSKPLAAHAGSHLNHWITGGGVIIGLEHVFQGEPLHGAMYAASTVAALATMRQFTKLIDNPAGRRFLSAANKLSPNSPALARMIERIVPLVTAGAGEKLAAGRNAPDPFSFIGPEEPKSFDFGKYSQMQSGAASPRPPLAGTNLDQPED